MNLLTPLAGLVGLQVDTVTDKLRRAVVVNGLVGLLVLVALCFAAVAGFMALSELIGPKLTALCFAGGALVLALAIYLGSLVGQGARRQRELERRRATETNALLATAAVSALPLLLKAPLARNIGLPLAALAAFLALGKSGDDDETPP